MDTPPATANCVLDRTLVNEETLDRLQDIGVSIFAPACSKNRGAFVLDPPDGNTYGCLALPYFEAYPNVTSVEDIKKEYGDGNLTAADTVDLLDFLVERSYASTPGVEVTPYACDMSGLATLTDCPTTPTTTIKTPIRSVTVAGVFAPAAWSVTNSSTPIDVTLTQRDAEFYYVAKDFQKMAKMGLNTVQFPVAVELFDVLPKPHVAWINLLTKWIRFAAKYKLQAIVKLEFTHGRQNDMALTECIRQALIYFNGININDSGPMIAAVTLPSSDPVVMNAAASAETNIPLWLPAQLQDLTKVQEMASTIAGVEISAISLDLSHTSTIAEIASSTPQEDRAKLTFHETMACLKRAPLEYSACYQGLPVFVAYGFNLAIDDCHMARFVNTRGYNFNDYGQCGRLKETLNSPWWFRHRYSFAARQIAAYEKGGLGWSFATWKVFRTGSEKAGKIDNPAKLLALEDIHDNGWFPELVNNTELQNACLNPPATDFVLGDETLAPTAGPPPDCGNGWWNDTTLQCDFWIPPPFNATECPNTTIIYEECPTASGDMIDVELPAKIEEEIESTHPLLSGFVAGVLTTCAIVAVMYRLCCQRRLGGYESVPNPYHNNGFQEYYHHSQGGMEREEQPPKPLHASRGAGP